MIQIPFMFTPDYFTRVIQEPSQSFVFPPVSVAVTQIASSEPKVTEPKVTEPKVTESQPQQKQPLMFHAGNKTHDALFVCFYVLLNGAMKYHQNTRSWNVLERQHKISFAAKLRTDENHALLNEAFNKVLVGNMDDELANTSIPNISVKTFAALCFTSGVSIMVIDDNLCAMTIIQPSTAEFPEHALHIKDGSSYIMWNECATTKYDDCQYVNTTNLGFTAQLIDQVKEKEEKKEMARQAKQTILTLKHDQKNDRKNDRKKTTLKAIGSYRTEELQAMCADMDIGYMDIPFAGKKVLKKDMYDYIKNKMNTPL